MKRLLATVLITLIGMALMSPSAMAQPGIEPVKIIENEVLLDQQALYDRAKKGISDIEVVPQTTMLIDPNSKNAIELDVISTTQLQKEIHYSDGQIEKKYVTANFAVVANGDIDTLINASMNPVTSQDITILSVGNKWDPSISVRAYSVVYWSYYGSNVQIDYVTGGWENTDSTRVGIKDRRVTLGQVDPNHQNQSQYFYPTGDAFTIYRPSTWQPVWNNGATVMGCTSKATLYRTNNPSSNWELELSNNLTLPQ